MPQLVKQKKPISAEQAASFERMRITIEGIADRAASSVDSLVGEMAAAGVSPAGIKTRLAAEIESGRILSEMRNFATAKIPCFIGDMTFRFARDTLADKQKQDDFRARLNGEMQELRSVQADKERGMSPMTEEALQDRQAQADAILDALEKQGIDIGSYVGDEFPEPPPDAPLDEAYLWVAVEDNHTCDVCSGNHGEEHTLAEWSEIGEPRSGTCAGEERCRCVLVPVAAMSDTDKQHLKDVVTVVK